MSALILDGRSLARELRAELTAAVNDFSTQHTIIPTLAVVQVSGDDAGASYIGSIRRLSTKLGMRCLVFTVSPTATQRELNLTIHELSEDPAIHGILIEMPLPPHFSVRDVVLNLDPHKDVDGIHPLNVGLHAQGQLAMLPNTPAGGMELLRRYDIPLSRTRAAVVGYSNVVGRPMAEMLLAAEATVTICHRFTPDLGAVLRECEIVAVAVGKPGLVTGDMLRPGSVVVDFGINVQPDGSIVGDVDFASASTVARAITPVPGGTGPVTNIMLMRNVLTAVRRQLGVQD